MTEADRLRAFEKTLISEARFRRYLQTIPGKRFLASLPPRTPRQRVRSILRGPANFGRRVYVTWTYNLCQRRWASVPCRRLSGHKGLCTPERHAVENFEVVRSC